MSGVFSFRLSECNPREAQAREVIKAWVAQGYSLRQVLTEALLVLGNHEKGVVRMDDMDEVIDRLSRLVDRLEGHINVQTSLPVNSELSALFVSSIKMAIKPGIRINSD